MWLPASCTDGLRPRLFAPKWLAPWVPWACADGDTLIITTSQALCDSLLPWLWGLGNRVTEEKGNEFCIHIKPSPDSESARLLLCKWLNLTKPQRIVP